MRDADWLTIERLTAWLDDADAAEPVALAPGREAGDPATGVEVGLLLRLLKLSEEVGEVSAAVIGATGQNPRKGVTHTWGDVQNELCDVIITALVALRSLGPDAPEVLTARLEAVAARIA